MDWILAVQDRPMAGSSEKQTLKFHKNWGISGLARRLLASHGLCFMELV
jgi:hypothetical protein